MNTASFSGQVIHGDHFGTVLGYPTANIDRVSQKKLKLSLKFGVYAGWVVLPNHKKYRAGVVIGPKDKHNLPKLEAYLIGFKGNLYGKKITVILAKYLRPFRKFTTNQNLQRQIRADVAAIKKLL